MVLPNDPQGDGYPGRQPQQDGSPLQRASFIFDVQVFEQDIRRHASGAIVRVLGESDSRLESYLSDFLLRSIRSETVVPTDPRNPWKQLTLTDAMKLADDKEHFRSRTERAEFFVRTGEYVLFILSFPEALRHEARRFGSLSGADELEEIGQNRFEVASRIVYPEDKFRSDRWDHVRKFFPSCASASRFVWQALTRDAA
jgi:hypothetical protein